jgi:CRP/FNR family transcriptional regulator
VVFLRKGMAKVHLTGPSREQIVKLVKAPTYLGLPTTFGDKINQYSVTSVVESEVCFIDIEVFKKLLAENPDFSAYILMELCKSELEAYHRCAGRTQKQLRGNLADVLLEFSERLFESDRFLLPLSQSDIGNWVDHPDGWEACVHHRQETTAADQSKRMMYVISSFKPRSLLFIPVFQSSPILIC